MNRGWQILLVLLEVQDSSEEFERNLLEVTPSPCDLISVHRYGTSAWRVRTAPPKVPPTIRGS